MKFLVILVELLVRPVMQNVAQVDPLAAKSTIDCLIAKGFDRFFFNTK